MAIAKFTIEMAADLGQLKRDVSNINDVVSKMGQQMAARSKLGIDAVNAVGVAHENMAKKAQLSEQAQAKAARQVQQQNIQLAYQLQDFGVQIAGGQNPLLAFVQQGSQLSGVYGGAGKALKAVFELMTPLRIAFGGAAGAVLTLAYAWNEGDKQSAAFRKSLELTGNMAGMTAGRFDTMVFDISEGANLGAGKVREMAQELVSSGRFGSTGFEEMAKTASLMADITGKSAQEVVQDLTSMADAPAAWAASRNKSLHFITDAELKHIEVLEANGRREEAVRAVQDALGRKYTEKVAQNAGYLERLAKSVSKEWSSTWDAIYGLGREESIDEQIAEAMGRLDKARAYQESLRKGGVDLYNAGGYIGSVESAEAALQKLYDKKSAASLKAYKDSKTAADEDAATEKRRLQERLQGMVLANDLAKNEATAKLNLLDIERRIFEIQQSATTDGRDLEGQQLAAQQIAEQKLLEKANERRKVLSEIARVKAQPQDKPEQVLSVQQQLIGLNNKLVDMDANKLNLQSQAYTGYIAELQALQEIGRAQAFSLSFVGKTTEEVNALVFADGMRVQTTRAIQAEYKNLADGVINLTELERRKAEIERQASEANAEWGKLHADQLERVYNATRGISDAMLEYAQQSQRAGELAKQATSAVLADMERSFTDFFKTGKLNAAAFVDTLINEFLRLQVVKPMMNNLMSSGGGDVLSALFGSGKKSGAPDVPSDINTSGFGTPNYQFMPSANGNVFDLTGLVHKFANGGVFTNDIVTHPTRFAFAGGVGLMGEAGPEAVVPLRRDSRGRLGLMSNGGNAPNVTVQVINQGGTALQVTGQSQNRGPDGGLNVSVVVKQLQDALAEEVDNGAGSLFHAINGRFVKKGSS